MNMTREIWNSLHQGDTIIDYKGNRWEILEKLSSSKMKLSTPMSDIPEAVFFFDSEVGVLHEASRSNVTALSRDIQVGRG